MEVPPCYVQVQSLGKGLCDKVSQKLKHFNMYTTNTAWSVIGSHIAEMTATCFKKTEFGVIEIPSSETSQLNLDTVKLVLCLCRGDD